MLESLLDRLETLVATHILAAEGRLFAGLRRIVRDELHSALTPIRETIMSDLTDKLDAFASVVTTFESKLDGARTTIASLQGQVDSLTAANTKLQASAASDDVKAEMQTAADRIAALTAEMQGHLADPATSTPAPDPVPASAPVPPVEPAPTPVPEQPQPPAQSPSGATGGTGGFDPSANAVEAAVSPESRSGCRVGVHAAAPRPSNRRNRAQHVAGPHADL